MRYLFLLCAFILSAACFAQDSVRLSGHVDNGTSDTVELTYNDNNLAYYPVKFYARLDKKANFKCTFPVPRSVFVQVELKQGNRLAELILRGGDSLHLTVNALHFDTTIHYTGRGAGIQNFVARHTLEKGRMNQYTGKLKQAMTLEPDAFRAEIEKAHKDELQFLTQHGGKLPPEFVNYWKAFFRYYNYFFTEQYPLTHQVMAVKRFTDTIPAANFSVVSELPYAFNDSFLQLPPYLLYLTGIFETRLRASGYFAYRADTTMTRMVEDSVYALGYSMLPTGSAEFFMAQNLYGRAKGQDLQRTEAQFAAFRQHWPNSQYLPLLARQVATAERLAPGQPAPDLDIVTPEGKHMKLSDLRGYVVYLGFWGSFCRQCVGEMMSERKIKDLMKNKPVKFVYVSIDDDAALDKTLAEKYKIDGIFIHAASGWTSKEVEQYGVQTLPAYFLIDEDGKIAVRNPALPGQFTELVLQIGRLLK